jgi:hypothetical protein
VGRNAERCKETLPACQRMSLRRIARQGRMRLTLRQRMAVEEVSCIMKAAGLPRSAWRVLQNPGGGILPLHDASSSQRVHGSVTCRDTILRRPT